MLRKDLRNIAIVAHVDHGKTTLVDHMLRQAGAFRDNEVVAERVMDSNDLERERGITILAKNTSVRYKGVKINIVDTPGHSDFGGEVERTLMMADGALLLVDAAEGPLPQTRFVLSKCLERGFPVVVVINKIDRGDARPHDVLSRCSTSSAISRRATISSISRTSTRSASSASPSGSSTDEAKDLIPLFDMILERVPAPPGDVDGPLQMIVCNTAHDDYVGRLAVGRVVRGTVKPGDEVVVIGENGSKKGTAKLLYSFEGLRRAPADKACAGDVIALAGLDEVNIGDTVASPITPEALPRIVVEEPTIKMRIGVNTSPFAGKSKESKYLTSRHLKERLEREAMKNLAIRVEPTETADTFLVMGRGELQLAILVETMRREGYEMQLSNPEVVTREIDGELMEPVERVVVDVPDAFVGVVTERMGERRGRMTKMSNPGMGRARLEYACPPAASSASAASSSRRPAARAS
jgi:GTP-binding protein